MRSLLSALLALALAGRAARAQAAPPPPEVPREFRAAWVASVSNIDWPSRPGLPVREQQAELLAMLDRARDLNLNAVILQVRPAADALYASSYEPWSEYLTGQMGRAPEPFYDPLAFAVREAHARGLELHAWFNPFRARQAGASSSVSVDHVSRRRPSLVRRYGSMLWMDPGEPAVQAHSLRVIADVVRRYDIDGVHIDDYFYPYRENAPRGGYLPFPDASSYAKYRRGGGRMARDDWRRENVNRFVRTLYSTVKETKPWVKVGISPFGIWRPGSPAQISGLDAYQEIFADSRKWFVNGWLDYFVPQLYWRIDAPGQSYPVLLEWWTTQNRKGRHLWPGNYSSRSAGLATPVWGSGELLDQIALTRAQEGATGNVHFSMSALMPRPGASTLPPFSPLPVHLGEQLAMGPYAMPALVPASPWLGQTRPAPPKAALVADAETGGALLRLAPGDSRLVRLWVVKARYGSEWLVELVPGGERSRLLTENGSEPSPDEVLVSAIDRVGNESGTAIVLPAPVVAGTGSNER